MKDITIYTDGACKGNPGPGGWAAILVYGGHEKVISGHSDGETTNNRMELTAVIEAVKACKIPCNITVVSDSTYVVMTKDKWASYMRKRVRKNYDLWKELLDVARAGGHTLAYQHVDGHSGNPYNERCDAIAKAQCALVQEVAA